MDDLELDAGSVTSGPAPGSEPAALELDLDSTAQPEFRHAQQQEAIPPAPRTAPATSTLPPSMQPAAPVSETQQALELARQADQRAQMALGVLTPFLSQLHAQGQGNAPKRLTLEQMVSDPNVTTKDLLEYVQAQISEGLTTHSQTMELTARRGSSEQYARGLFHGDGFDAGHDFDTMRSKYIAPVLERIPYLRDVFTAINPEQPAMIEYGMAALLEISARSKDDPVTFYRNLWSLLGNGAGADQGEKIQQAATAAAARIARGSDSGRPASARSGKVDGRELWALSDSAFERLDRELTGGL